MPAVALPTVKQFTIVTCGKVRRSTHVDIEHSDGITQFKPAKQNLCKLLLIARLWGIRVRAQEVDTRQQELLWALVSPWKWSLGLTLAAFILAGLVGFFAGGVIDNPQGMAMFFTEKGIWQWLVLGTAILSAVRLFRWRLAYGRFDPTICLTNRTNADGQVPGESCPASRLVVSD